MATTLNASTSSGLVQSADTSGTLELQSNGTTKLTVGSTGVTVTSISGAITASTAQTTSSGTSFDFTGIPSWVKRITFMASNLSTSGTDNVLLQIGGSGGLVTSGYVGNTNAFNTSPGSTSYSTGFVLAENISASANLTAIATILNINGNDWVFQTTQGDSTTIAGIGAGRVSLTETLTQLRLLLSGSNTFDSGTINIFYEG